MTEPESAAAPRRWLLLGRPDCPLCEEMALAVHERFGAAVVLDHADVDTRPDWQRRYGLRVPVVLDEWNEVVLEGRLED